MEPQLNGNALLLFAWSCKVSRSRDKPSWSPRVQKTFPGNGTGEKHEIDTLSSSFHRFSITTCVELVFCRRRAGSIRQSSIDIGRYGLRLLAVRSAGSACPPTAEIQGGQRPLQTCVACDALRPRAQFGRRLRPRGNRRPLEGQVRVEGKYRYRYPGRRAA